MIRRKAVELGDLVHQFLRAEGLETPLNEYRAVRSWPEIAGPNIQKYTGDVFVKNGILNIKIKSPALRQNLNMNRTVFAQRINEHVGAQVITEVRFY
ncbi:MAG: DUF721 domain-containing protein [Bacteroidaceae bacterium]|nr:DUF721 domain-containing protein [Bacteroidaceae bacterium]